MTGRVKQDADYIFHELTRSICPECKTLIDAQIIIRANKVYMRKRCPQHGWFEGLISSDAEMYVDSIKFNKPGTLPLQHTTEVVDGCPMDCGLCPEHKQHICLAIIEVNTGCNLNCPICFANAGPGYSLTMEQVESMLDRFVETEGNPEVVQFSGGEPTLHPRILDMVQAAQDRGIGHVMINTNGVRIARDDRFLEGLARLKPAIYFQFDGLEDSTYRAIRGEDLLETKLKALDRLAQAGLDVGLVAAVERGVNDHEVGAVLKFGLEHPAVHGIAFQPVTHSGRFFAFDPLDRETLADVIHGIAEQTDGLFVESDFIPVPCCHPTCRSVTYAYVENGKVIPLPRVVDVDKYLDYIANRTLPDIRPEILEALEGLWSASSVPGTETTAARFHCAACDLSFSNETSLLKEHVFMIVVQSFADPYTMDLKALMKCCVGELIPDGRSIPFCAYNSVGYREKVRAALISGKME